MRRLAKAPSAGSNSGTGTTRARKSLFGMTCACVLGLTAFLGSGAPIAAAVEACPNAQFRQGAAAALPSCRAYEQVSPADKNGHDINGMDETQAAYPVSPFGNAAMFGSKGSFAGNPTGGAVQGSSDSNVYFSALTDGQWVTTPLMPRATHTSTERDVFLVAPDFTTSLIQPLNGAFDPDPPPSSGVNFYLHQNFTATTDLLFNSPSQGKNGVGASSDLGHIAFSVSSVMVADPDVPPSGLKTYEVLDDGEIRLVSRQPGTDLPFATEAVLAGGAAGAVTASGGLVGVGRLGSRPVSADGSKIFFETPATAGGPSSNESLIYRRSNGTTTELASPSQRTTPDPLGPRRKVFRVATPDGNRLFFTSQELLTDDANTGPERKGNDLYRYDMTTEELVDVSASADGDGARVQGVVGVSDDGNRVYYVGLGALAPGAVPNERNVYLWEDDGTPAGKTRFITRLASGSPLLGNLGDTAAWVTSSVKTSRVTPDGRYLLLRSRASLTGYPNEGTFQIYRYDADANSGAGEMLCVSCSESATPPAVTATVPTVAAGLAPTLSADGKYVFFNTVDALLPRDTNGLIDPYVWSEGEVSLLSTGTSPNPSRFTSASADGTDAFFVTTDPLVPQDIDSNADLYAASVGGGLPAQFATPPPDCAGEECRGAGSQPPAVGGPLTSSFSGAGNARQPTGRRCGKGKRRVKAGNKTRCVKKRNRANRHRRASR